MGNATKTTSYGMLKGYFPRDPTLVSAQASLGVSPEGDPGWESISAGILGNGRFGHGDKMGENLRVWVILWLLLPP